MQGTGGRRFLGPLALHPLLLLLIYNTILTVCTQRLDGIDLEAQDIDD